MSNQRVFIASLAILGLAISGCSDDPEPETEPFPLDTPREQTTAPEGGAESPTAAPTSAVPELPQECSDVIRYVDVLDAVAVPLSGGVSPIFVDGGFHEASGRLQRLTCSYFANTAGNDDEDEEAEQPPPVLEISVSSYVDAAHASTRVADTIAGGSQVEPLEVAGTPGYVLTGEETITFVAALEHLTYVASLRRGVVPESAEPVVLIGLAEHLVGGDDTATDG